MSVGVIDLLEMINVHQNDRKMATMTLVSIILFFQLSVHVPTIGQLRQLVRFGGCFVKSGQFAQIFVSIASGTVKDIGKDRGKTDCRHKADLKIGIVSRPDKRGVQENGRSPVLRSACSPSVPALHADRRCKNKRRENIKPEGAGIAFAS